MDRRVVITGFGVISSLGNNVNDFWKDIIETAFSLLAIHSNLILKDNVGPLQNYKFSTSWDTT